MTERRDPAEIEADRRFMHLVVVLSIIFSGGAALFGRFQAAAEPYTVGVRVDEAGLGLIDEAQSYGAAVWYLHRQAKGTSGPASAARR